MEQKTSPINCGCSFPRDPLFDDRVCVLDPRTNQIVSVVEKKLLAIQTRAAALRKWAGRINPLSGVVGTVGATYMGCSFALSLHMHPVGWGLLALGILLCAISYCFRKYSDYLEAHAVELASQ